jgi:hypothetical protein
VLKYAIHRSGTASKVTSPIGSIVTEYDPASWAVADAVAVVVALSTVPAGVDAVSVLPAHPANSPPATTPPPCFISSRRVGVLPPGHPFDMRFRLA